MKRVAILTNFHEFMPGYSLTSIVKSQARMLMEHGHEVHLFTNEKYHGEKFDERIVMHHTIPFAHLHDFSSRAELDSPKFQSKEGKPAQYFRDLISNTTEVLKRDLQEMEVAFTHDWVFQGWFAPLGWAVIEASKQLPKTKWFHWIHSVPTGRRDYWDINLYGPRHKLIYPNVSDKVRVAEAYNGKPSDVRVIPHMVDMRVLFEFDKETCDFISEYPAIMQADVVQVYPASVDRLEAKRLREVITIFSNFKQMGKSVCLVIANQWATTPGHKQTVEKYKGMAVERGLKPNEEVIFTSDWKVTVNEKTGQSKGKYEVGLPHRILRELYQLSNLFIFPTKEETFGLVLPEVSLAAGAYCVVNASLRNQFEISGHTTMGFDFGSFHHDVHWKSGQEPWLRDVATLILGRMNENEAIRTKTFFRQRNNYDNLYREYYAPIMAESERWDV